MAESDSAASCGAMDDYANADLTTLFELGIAHSAGSSGPADLVLAHKWFNIAAMLGHEEAARYRREIAAEMSDSEIGMAQRAARAWLKANRKPTPLSVAA
jgi:TPR repeat protein